MVPQDYKLEKGSKPITVTKSLSIQKAPRVLVVHLTRYKWMQEGAGEAPLQHAVSTHTRLSKPTLDSALIASLRRADEAVAIAQRAARSPSPSASLGSSCSNATCSPHPLPERCAAVPRPVQL